MNLSVRDEMILLNSILSSFFLFEKGVVEITIEKKYNY